MKLRCITAGLALSASLAIPAYAGFTPIAINTNSFNEDPVVELLAPVSLNDSITATMDGGTNRSGNTWYEMGYNAAAPATGLPVHGSVFGTNGIGGTYPGNFSFVMPSDYHQNSVIFLGHNNGGRTPIVPGGTLTLTTPGLYNGLAFLCAAGNGPVLFGVNIHHSDSTIETVSPLTALDWFNGSARVYNAAGRVSMGGGTQNVNGNPAGALFAVTVPCNSAVNATSVDFFFVGGSGNGNTNNNGRAMILAVSGATDGINFTNTLALTGFNFKGVVPADAPPTTGTGNAGAGILTNNVTFTMDGGTTLANNTWFEKGYYASMPNLGLPNAGSSFSSAANPAVYTMPSTYGTNCAICLSATVSNANIAFAAPGSYGGLSFLCASANGDTAVPCVIQYLDGTSETNFIFSPDWWNRTVPWAYHAFGRIAPSNRTINNSLEQFVDPFGIQFAGYDYRPGGQTGYGLPVNYLFDAIINVTNSTGVITNISLNFTNGPTSGRTVAIFAVSGAPAGQVPPALGAVGTVTPGQPTYYYTPATIVHASVGGNAGTPTTLIKAYQGTTNAVLSVTNITGSGPLSFQWKKAASGEGFHDKYYLPDYNLFSSMTDGGRIQGSTTSALTISNADLVDSADYLCTVSNPYGAVTSLVVTLNIQTTNSDILSGVPAGDAITAISSDSAPAAESLDHVIDLVAQKWLSDGLQFNGPCCGGGLPWVGSCPGGCAAGTQVGFVVTPVAGASIVSSVRIFTANDTPGRDPMDFTLEGSNDGSTFTRLAGAVLKGSLSLPSGRNGTGSAGLDPLGGTCVEVDFANAVGYKYYRYTLTNVYDVLGTPLMQVAEVQLLGTLVPNPPVWVRQPESTVTVFVGANPSFTVEAGGYPPPKYQWYKNGTTLIPGATAATYTFPNAQLTDSGTTFSCTASNTFGLITSSSVTLQVIAAPTQPYPSSVVADGPIAYWRLDEGPDNGAGNDGTTAHDYMGGHDGFYSNAVIAVAGYNSIADPDTAAQFGTPAANSFVAEILNIDFARKTNALTGGTFSVEAWADGPAQLTNSAILTKGYNGVLNAGTGTGTEQFVLDTLGNVYRFLVRDAAGNGHVATASAPPTTGPDGRWHHLVGVCDQPHSNVFLYVDGQLAGSGTIAPNVGILTQPLPVEIGSRQDGGATDFTDQWLGQVDEVAIYNVVLSPARIQAHFFAAAYPPVITLSPTNTTINENLPVTLFSEAYGAGTVSFQWYNSDGANPTTPIGGATASNYTFTVTAAQNNNFYQVVVANAFGSSTSAVAQLFVSSGAPVTGNFLLDIPSSQTVGIGHVVTLHVVPNGSAPFTYQWQKNGVNISDDYRTAGSHTDTLIIGYGAYTDSGSYQLLVANGSGNAVSTLDAVTVTNITSTFFNAGSTTTDWQMNNGAGFVPVLFGTNAMQLTDNSLGSTANSAFLKTPRNIGSFNCTFTYQDVSGANGADGVCFCIQNTAATAVGGGGGQLGVAGITPSWELELNIYAPNTRGYAFDVNGAIGPSISLLPNVSIGDNSNPVKVEITYNGTVLNAKLTDLVTLGTATVSDTVNIPTVVGSSTAFVGFTGADGGVNATQIISWGGNPAPTPIPLTFTKVGNNVVLSWPASAGAFLMNSPGLGGFASWTQDNTDTFRVVGSQSQVTVVEGGAQRFFRLLIFP